MRDRKAMYEALPKVRAVLAERVEAGGGANSTGEAILKFIIGPMILDLIDEVQDLRTELTTLQMEQTIAKARSITVPESKGVQ